MEGWVWVDDVTNKGQHLAEQCTTGEAQGRFLLGRIRVCLNMKKANYSSQSTQDYVFRQRDLKSHVTPMPLSLLIR